MKEELSGRSTEMMSAVGLNWVTEPADSADCELISTTETKCLLQNDDGFRRRLVEDSASGRSKRFHSARREFQRDTGACL